MATNPRMIDAASGPATTGRRSAARARLQANASLETTTGDVQVVLRNLSCTGAMVEGKKLPAVNRTVLLKRGRIEALAAVVWQDGGRCGLEFFDPLTHDEVVREARRPPERIVQPVQSHWTPAGFDGVVSIEDWEKARARAERDYLALRGFS